MDAFIFLKVFLKGCGVGALLWLIFGGKVLRALGISNGKNKLQTQINELVNENRKLVIKNNQYVNASQEERIRKIEGKEYYESIDLSNPENQYRFVNEAKFYADKVINKQAYFSAFMPVETYVKQHHPSYRVLAEVGMGAFVKTSKTLEEKVADNAFKSYNSKRIDVLVIDHLGMPLLAVEYQGTGHHGRTNANKENAIARDRVKKLALEKAGIHLLEIEYDTTPEQVRNLIKEALN